MKNLIITFCNENNLGANLQAFALQEILKIKGETKLLNYDLKNEKSTIERKLKDFLLKPINYVLFKSFKNFRKENYNLTKKVHTIKEIEILAKEYDNIICGSDQIWNYDIVGSQFDIYSINFNTSLKSKKFSYAASIGTNSIPDITIKKLQQILPSYNGISIREKSAVKELHNNGIDKAIEVLDPTFLLESKQWDEKLNIKNLENKKYIFVYYLDDPNMIKKACNEISALTNYEFICYGKKSILKKNPDIKNCTFINQIGPKEFLEYIKNAEFIVTNSFHAIAFSIIYSKQFLTVLNGNRGIRQENILKKFGIENRIYNTDISNVEILLNTKINYNDVYKKLNMYRKKSIEFIDKIK